MRISKIAILAVIISLMAHSLFLAASPYIVLHGMRQIVDQTRKMFRLKDVQEKITTVSFTGDVDQQVLSVKMSQPPSGLKDKAFQKMMLEEKAEKDLSLDSKKEKLKKEKLDRMEKEKFDIDDMLKTEAEKSKKEIAPEERSLAEKLLSEEMVEQADRSGADVNHDAVQRSLNGPVSDADNWDPSLAGSFRPGDNESSSVSGRTRVGDYVDIGEYLEVYLSTYVEPDTGEKYFKLIVMVLPGVQLKAIPKEVIFLLDSSKSITEEKLSYIKKGVYDSVKNLNPGDRFNTIAFRGDLIKFENASVPVREKSVDEVRTFIEGLQAIGQTDVENALLGITKEPVRFDPSYVILMTDGRPTTGVTDSRKIIQQITRTNNMKRSIFCFGGGRRVNKYLLDFISYQNRAWSHFAKTTYDMEKDFDIFFDQIKDPLLLNVRYLLNGVDSEEVYPKYLSDFYLGRPFVLYGRYEDEDLFSMQLLGGVDGTTKEFIFKQSLKSAQEGGEEIAREWAFMKMYYLISRNTMGKGDPVRLRGEIDKLSRKYNIPTPYDIQDEAG